VYGNYLSKKKKEGMSQDSNQNLSFQTIYGRFWVCFLFLHFFLNKILIHSVYQQKVASTVDQNDSRNVMFFQRCKECIELKPLYFSMSLLCHLVMAFPEHKLYHNLIKIDEKQV
jgi:hypothetical protein